MSTDKPSVDVLIITALQDELNALKGIDLGAKEGSTWEEKEDRRGFPYWRRTFLHEDGQPLEVVVARPVDMGGAFATNLATRLVGELEPRCLAMCGICAGRRGKVSLGDVIVASQAFHYEAGKIERIRAESGEIRERIFHQIDTYKLSTLWNMSAQEFPDLDKREIGKDRPPTYEEQERWLLQAQYAYEEGKGEAPVDHPQRRACCPDWKDVRSRLRKKKLLKVRGLALTQKGREAVKEEVLDYPDGRPPAEPFQVHVAPIATGSRVVVDEEIFGRLSEQERRVLGLEMEAAAIGLVAEVEGIPHFLVAKGVQDFADQEKDDLFRKFASRASADFLLRILRRHLPASDVPGIFPGGASVQGRPGGESCEVEELPWGALPVDEQEQGPQEPSPPSERLVGAAQEILDKNSWLANCLIGRNQSWLRAWNDDGAAGLVDAVCQHGELRSLLDELWSYGQHLYTHDEKLTPLRRLAVLLVGLLAPRELICEKSVEEVAQGRYRVPVRGPNCADAAFGSYEGRPPLFKKPPAGPRGSQDYAVRVLEVPTTQLEAGLRSRGRLADQVDEMAALLFDGDLANAPYLHESERMTYSGVGEALRIQLTAEAINDNLREIADEMGGRPYLLLTSESRGPAGFASDSFLDRLQVLLPNLIYLRLDGDPSTSLKLERKLKPLWKILGYKSSEET
ncbi:MAG: hypothetical protein KDD47_14170 [Acidobacteria bacterium]|nr:hypothetical protein [Acidobacteriota bacterium]